MCGSPANHAPAAIADRLLLLGHLHEAHLRVVLGALEEESEPRLRQRRQGTHPGGLDALVDDLRVVVRDRHGPRSSPPAMNALRSSRRTRRPGSLHRGLPFGQPRRSTTLSTYPVTTMSRIALLLLAHPPLHGPGMPAPSPPSSTLTPKVLVVRVEGVDPEVLADAWTPTLDGLRVGGMYTGAVRAGAAMVEGAWSGLPGGGLPPAMSAAEAMHAARHRRHRRRLRAHRRRTPRRPTPRSTPWSRPTGSWRPCSTRCARVPATPARTGSCSSRVNAATPPARPSGSRRGRASRSVR